MLACLAAEWGVMRSRRLSCGLSVFGLILIGVAAVAQEALPTIEVGAERRRNAPQPNENSADPVIGQMALDAAQGVKDKFGNIPMGTYVTPDATTATKMETPLLDVPQSVKVITPQLIQDQGPQLRVYELARQVSGVIANPLGGQVGAGNSPNYQIRGFSNGGVVLLDGMWRYYQESAIDLYNIDHVEFAKGPSSTLYGDTSGSYGGTVNFIRKSPTDKFFSTVEEGVGSFGFHRTTLDFNSPLREDKSILFRLNAVVEQKNGVQHQEYHDAVFVSPALTWVLDNDDQLDFRGEYGVTHERASIGSPAFPVFQLIPRETYIGDIRFNAVHPIANATLKYTHKFNPDWSITAIADYNYTREYVPAANLTFDGVSQLDLGNSNYRFTPHEDTFQGEIDLKGKFETAFIKHDVLLGVYRRNSWRIMDTVIAAPPSPEAINIFYPIYPNTACFFGGPGCPLVDGAAQIDVKTRTQMNAAYAQDLIRLTEQFKLLVGGRYDRVIEWDEFKNPDQNFGGDSLTITKYGFFSPHVGGVFQPFKETSIFAAWGKSFAPNFTLLGPGRPAPPEYSTQIDVGVKQDLFDGRAQVGITAFDIERTNIVVADPTDPLGQRNLLLGKYKSHGLEFDLGGEILPNFRVNAALTFMHGVAGKDTNTPTSEGSELNFSPRRFYNFTGIYSFKEGALKGLQLGANFYYASKTPALFPNGPAANFYALQNGGLSISGQNQYPFQIAPIYSFGLYASYEITDCLKVQVNANNLFDRANWQTAGNGFMARGVPRSIFANISYQFK